ncbi:hypothetical protein Taro_040816 [Colocasia esculenta]|uniref:Uncharacterized protein n=1 Tax=Colocasia esculenta TaxID=4460 RepID=A0A843WJY9_COLES|nr:hypothetical protein [Colocasia esculenta]
MGRFPSGDWGVVAPEGSCGAVERCRGARRRWPTVVGSVLRESSARRDIRRGVGPVGRDLIATLLAVAIRVCRDVLSGRDRVCCHDALPRRDKAGVTAPVLVTMRLSLLPGTPILGSLLRECSGLRACSSWQLTGQTLELRGKQGLDSGAESFVELSYLGRDAEVVEGRSLAWLRCSMCCVFLATLSRPSAWVEVGFRLASRACELRVPLLAASSGGLVAVVVTTRASGGFRFCVLSVPWTRSWVPVCSGTSVYGFPTLRCIWGLGWFCLWAFDPVEVGCICCCAACMASVVARRVRAVAAWVALDSLAVVFPVWRTIAGKSKRGAPGLFPVGLVEGVLALLAIPLLLGLLRHLSVVVVGLVLVGCGLWCIAWLPCVLVRFPRTICYCPVRSGDFSQNDALVVLVEVLLGPACVASIVLLAAVFSLMVCVVWVVHSGEGSSQDRLLLLLVEVLSRSALCSFRAIVVLLLWIEVCRLVGLHSGVVSRGVVSLAMCLAVALASLSRCSAGAGVACCALSDLHFFACGFWKVSGEESFLLARGVASAAGAPVLKALAGYPFPPSLLFFPFPSSLAMGWFPSSDWGVVVPVGSCGVVGRRLRRGFVVLPRQFARCLALEGLFCSEVVFVAWDPRSRKPVEGVLWAMSVLELAADRADSGAEGKMSHVVVLGVGLQLGQAMVLRVLCVLDGSVSPFRGGGACTTVLAWLCLAPMGVVGLALGRPVLLVVSPSVFSWFRGPVLGCQSIVALACVPRVAFAVCPTPLVSVGVVCVSRPLLVVVVSYFPATLAGEGLVISTGPCSRGSPPYFLQLGAHRHGSSVSDASRRRLWRRVLSAVVRASVVSSCSRAREDEQRREERGGQQAPAPQGPMILPPPPLVDYDVFMQGLVKAMQTRAQTQVALQAQLQAQAQAPAPVPQEYGHGGPSIMERFKRMAPPSFKGESQPLLAESWMRQVEKIFLAIRCAEEDKERANVWWASELRTRYEDGAIETIQELTHVLLQAAQGGGNRSGVGELHRNFWSLNPPKFSGSMDSDEAEHWMKETGRIFRVMQCATGDKLLLDTFQLEKDARS